MTLPVDTLAPLVADSVSAVQILASAIAVTLVVAALTMPGFVTVLEQAWRDRGKVARHPGAHRQAFRLGVRR